MTRVLVAPNQFDQIIWPKERLYEATQTEWRKMKKTVRILCQSGKVTDWSSQHVQKSMTEWSHVPVEYKIEGLVVKFLPSDSWCNVDGLLLSPPTNKEDFREIIRAIKIFRRLGKTFRLEISDDVYGTING